MNWDGRSTLTCAEDFADLAGANEEQTPVRSTVLPPPPSRLESWAHSFSVLEPLPLVDCGCEEFDEESERPTLKRAIPATTTWRCRIA